MRLVPALAAVLLVPAAALAQDQGAPPPAADAKPATPAVERKTTPEALEAIAKHSSQVHSPTNADLKTLEASAEIEAGLPQLNNFDLTPVWTKEAGFDVKMKLRDDVRSQLPPQMAEQLEAQGAMMKGPLVQPMAMLYGTLEAGVEDYDVTHSGEGDKMKVELLPLEGRKTQWERRVCTFDESGLLRRMVAIPRVDIDNPQAAMYAGMEWEYSFTYGKVGNRHTVNKIDVLSDMGSMALTVEYYESDGKQLPLMKRITVENPFTPEPVVVNFKDYKVDGKPAPQTASKAVTPKDGDEEGDDGQDEGGKDENDDSSEK